MTVSRNFNQLSNEWEQMVMQRDFAGALGTMVLGAFGGGLATNVAQRLLPMVGFPAQPNTTQDLFVSGLVKGLFGAVLAFVGMRMRDSVWNLVTMAGLGALIVGGVDVVDAIDNAVGVVPFLPGLSPNSAGRRGGINLSLSNNGGRQLQQAQPQKPQGVVNHQPHTPEEEQVTAASAGY